MGVVLGMTAATNRRRPAIGLAHGCSGHTGLVAAFAGQSDMGIVERELGEVVRESNLNEARDIRIAAQVLGVAPAALAPGGLPHATVITAFGADIFDDLFVTPEALRALPVTVGEVVTVRALGLDLGVRL